MDDNLLFEQNPWWRSPVLIQNDQKIRELDAAVVRWEPRMMKHFILDQDLVYTLRGPRQVGKTTLIKEIIRSRILKEDADPFSIFYFSADMIDSRDQLLDAIESYERLADRFGRGGRRSIFIDEITNVKGWENAVKYLSDTGRCRNRTYILTGSHSIDLKYSIERLPGRRGEGSGAVLNKTLVPMKFSEYIGTVDKKLAKGLSGILDMKREKRISMVQDLSRGHIEKTLEKVGLLYSDELEKWLDTYLVTGGIPGPINHMISKGRIPDDVYGIYVRALIGDLARWGAQERIAKQVLRSIISKMTNKVSMNTIAKENEIGSHNTVMKYLDDLENSFVLNTFYQMDMAKGNVRGRSDKKYYLSDPFIYHALRGWAFGKHDHFGSSMELLAQSESRSSLIEMVVSNHLIRFAYSLSPSDIFSHHEKVMFWRKKGYDNEVDFIVRTDDDILPMEVKFRNVIQSSDLKGLYNFGRGIIISKKEMRTEKEYSCIPAKVFLLLI
ncbi:MAG: ATP-binding protein [Candidatus Thermoplasmatota archaeon]|nr:ATP-binding protein [Candidatus Thermoplasmatota archaeon]